MSHLWRRFSQLSSLVCEFNYMLVVDGFGHERDCQDDDTGGDEQDDGEVEVVDAAYDGGTVAGVGAAARPVGELCDHSGEANGEANHEAAKCTLKEVRRNLIGRLESVIDRMFIQLPSKCFFFLKGATHLRLSYQILCIKDKI